MKLTRLISALLLAGLIIFSQTGCKENTLINANVAPGINNVGVLSTDTFTIISTSVYDTNIVTSNSISGLPTLQGIGTINSDPFFGKTYASMYFQVIPEAISATFFNTDVIDSAVLMIPYSGYTYGDTTVSQTFNVYPVIDTVLAVDTPYKATTSLPVDKTTLYGSATVSVSGLNDSVYVSGANRPPALYIPLNSTFINRLKDLTVNHDTDYTGFIQALKGLYIESDPGMGKSISYFQLDGIDTFSRANILVYHHAPGGTENLFQYYFDPTYCAHYNKIIRDYTGSTAKNYFHATGTNDSIVIIQNQPGAALDVRIPFVKNSLPNCIINKAVLTITELSTYAATSFSSPAKLYSIAVFNDSTAEIQDRSPVTSISPLPFIDGYVRSVNIGGVSVSQYTINMPREVEQCIRQQRELHLRINGTQDYFGASRVVAAGGSYSDKNLRMRLNIVYSKLNK